MALDAYSYCPGGTGKKIKFCCGEFLGELQKIDRMLEGEQYQACLQTIERLREQPVNRDRPCLLAYQAELLRLTGQAEAAVRHIEAFLEKHPQNQTALAESAMVNAVEGDLDTAMERLQGALATAQTTEGVLSWQVSDAADLLAEAMMSQGRLLPVRALSAFLLSINKQDERAGRRYAACLHSDSMPLLLKEDPPIDPPPAGAAWKERFESALMPLRFGAWREAAENLAALAEKFPEVPAIWLMLARLRGWLGDDAGAVAALRKFAALPVPRDDAVEAEARALFLSRPPLGDEQDVLHVVWTVRDAERLHEALLSDNRFRSIPFDPAAFTQEDAPPPKALFLVLDRPALGTAAGATWKALPHDLGELVLFGKQTDREARLELMGMTRENYATFKPQFETLAGDALAPNPTETVLQTVSRSFLQLRPRWDVPQDATTEQLGQWEGDYLHDYLLNRWPGLSLGCLDGKTPRSVGADPAWRNRLLAVVLVLEHFTVRMRCREDYNRVRGWLGLPPDEPIDPAQTPLETVPVSRLARVTAEKLSEDDLVHAFLRAQSYRAVVAVRKFGEEILRRPGFEKKPERITVYATLSRFATDPEKALAYIDEGRQAAAAMGKSDAALDLQELQQRIARRQGAEILRLIEHIHTRHEKDADILNAMTEILVQTGILLPDGRMAIPVTREEMAQMQAASGQPVPPQAGEPGKLWTPESAAPAAAGKLWTPD